MYISSGNPTITNGCMPQDQHPIQKVFPGTGNFSTGHDNTGLRRRCIHIFALLFAVALGLRLLAMAAVPLIPEEAYYWMYAQHTALSYFDHPPMVAWVIGLGTAVFGDTEFGVRIVGNLLMLGASLLMYRFGRTWFSREAGAVAALLLQVLPVFFGIGFIATMDSALIFFWMLGLVGVTAALRDNRAWGWYLAGVALGSAVLSKYTGVFLAVGAVLAVVAHRPWRRHLLTVHPYLSILIAVALFSPVIIWNGQHDWASFRFQFLDRFGPKPLSLRTMLEFIGFQLLIATPIILWAYSRLTVQLLRTPRRALTPQSILIHAFSLPLLSMIAYKSLRYGVHINWTVPAFLSLLPAVSQWFLDRGLAAFERRPWTRGFAWTIMLCVVLNITVIAYLLILQPRVQWLSAFGPWQQLARIVEEHEDQLESETGREPLIVAEGEYRLASVLAFYRRPLEQHVNTAHYTTSKWILGGNGLGYPYWSDRNRWQGWDCIFIDDDEEDVLSRTRDHFDEVRQVIDARLLEIGRRKYQLIIGKHLR